MKQNYLLGISFLLFSLFASAQELHTPSNAVSVSNESATTTGWTNLANLQVESTDVIQGSFAFRASSTASNAREIRYSFPTVAGQTYNISIWAKRGAQFFNPAFANWSGFTGFTTTSIASTVWTEYTWTLTATGNTGTIRAYTSPISGGSEGDTILLDGVSIVANDTQAPTVVTNLTASNITQNSLNLSWNASTDNVGITGYEVFRNGTSVGTTTGATTLNISNLTANTSYSFTVTASDAAGNESAPSTAFQVSTLPEADTVAPSAVTSVNASEVTDTSVSLTWNASTDNVGVIDYEVFRDGVSQGLTGGATTFLASDLSPATEYNFTVFARDAAGNVSAAGNTFGVVTTSSADTEAPSQVTGITVTGVTSSGAELNWNPSTDNVGVFHYLIFLDGVYHNMVMSGTSFTLSNLDASTTYDLTIFAEDAAGNRSASSAIVPVTTLADTNPPSVPQNLAASNITTTSVSLSWTASVDDHGMDHYMVFRDGVNIGMAMQPTFNVTGLTAETGYAFHVVAMDLAGNASADSAVLQVTTLGEAGDTEAPSNVSDLAASNLTATSVTLLWSPSTDNVGVTNYHVFQNGTMAGNSGTDTTFNITGLTPETAYQFMVMAMDAAGNMSAMGNMVSVTTPVLQTVTDYTSENANLSTVDWQSNNMFVNGNLGIGTSDTSGYRLAVAGNVIAEEVRVALQGNWPDYVFKGNYQLPSLDEVREHIRANGHLIGVPSEKEVSEKGISLGEMNAILLEKIEELTLYMLQQQEAQKRLETAVKQIEVLENKIKELEKGTKVSGH